MNIMNRLNEAFTQAIRQFYAVDMPPIVTLSKRLDLADYQVNGVMALAKYLNRPPREVASELVSIVKIEPMVKSMQVAGPGFINIKLDDEFLLDFITSVKADANNLIEQTNCKQTIVVDYSGPNLAKEMHVGHLRSTIIGDAVARVLTALGHEVIRQNHVGDWGTQFGMLIAQLEDESSEDAGKNLKDLEGFYRQAKKRFDSEPEFSQRARYNVVRLQSGEKSCMKLWHQFIDQSLTHCNEIYERLGVSLGLDDVKAESAYNDELNNILKILEKKSLLVESEGAKCVFLPGFESKEGEPLPFIVQKSDGAYLYATTDLAALYYRIHTIKAHRILYFVDVRQSLHFKQLFALAERAGFIEDEKTLEHAAFGTMLGSDKKPFKTREGDVIKLKDLLDEACLRALAVVKGKQSQLDEAQHHNIAKVVGIGAVKYADLSKNRNNDYVFDWQKMLSLEGNTAPYIQYAYARIQSLLKKAGVSSVVSNNLTCNIEHQAERALVLKLLQFEEVLLQVENDLRPNHLTRYLYELTQLFMTFYECCSVINATENIKNSRLCFCKTTASTLKLGLNLLGIDVLERM